MPDTPGTVFLPRFSLIPGFSPEPRPAGCTHRGCWVEPVGEGQGSLARETFLGCGRGVRVSTHSYFWGVRVAIVVPSHWGVIWVSGGRSGSERFYLLSPHHPDSGASYWVVYARLDVSYRLWGSVITPLLIVRLETQASFPEQRRHFLTPMFLTTLEVVTGGMEFLNHSNKDPLAPSV